MTANIILGAFPEAPPSPALSAIELEVVPIDLVTEWRRCGMAADFMADYIVHGFERREVARSVLSTVLNELVENAAKFSSNKLTAAHVSIRHHGDVVHAEVRNEASDKDVQALRDVLAELAREEATAVFGRRMLSRRGLGLAMLAKDYGGTVGATVSPPGAGGQIAVCLRISLSAAEVEQR
jgi:hypothetical protein